MVDIKTFDYIEELNLKSAQPLKDFRINGTNFHRKSQSYIPSSKQFHLSSARFAKLDMTKAPEEVKPFVTPKKPDHRTKHSRDVFQQIFDKSTTAEGDKITSKIKNERHGSTMVLFKIRQRNSMYDPNLLIRSTEEFNELARKIDTFTIKTNLLPRLTSEDAMKLHNLYRKGQSSEFYRIKKNLGNKPADPDYFTLFKKKKQVKNFPNKKQLYNLDAEKILQHEYKPLKEFIRKNLANIKEAVDREILCEFEKPFMIVDQNRFSERYRISNEVIEHEKKCLLRSQLKAKEDKQHIQKLENIFVDHDLAKSKFVMTFRTKRSPICKA
jgi:hypothetical protein